MTQRPPQPPQICMACGTAPADWHCPNEQCNWVRCRQCKGISAVQLTGGQ